MQPKCIDGTKAHHIFINGDNIGTCIRPGCGLVKDYGAMMAKRERDYYVKNQKGGLQVQENVRKRRLHEVTV